MLKRKTGFVLFRSLLMLAAGVVLTLSTPSPAATDQADLSVGMKTLPLLTNKIVGSAAVAIVFNPRDPASKAEADGIKAMFDEGFEAPGDLKLTGVMVPVTNLDRMAGSRVAVLTGGLADYFDPISDAAARGSILTMSTDLNCVRSNKCVLGIVSKPHVQIYFSKAAAEAAKIGFAEAFTMLVKLI